MTDCNLRHGEICLWASKVAGNLPVFTDDGKCFVCLNQQERSKKRKGHAYRRTNIVNRLAAEKFDELSIIKNVDNLIWVSKYLKQWKRLHINQFIANGSHKETFSLLNSVGLYECVIQHTGREWSETEIVNEYLVENDRNRYLSFIDFSSSKLFFESLAYYLHNNGENLGEHLNCADYPIWVDWHKDQPNPQSKNCIITVCAGDRYLKMFEVIKDRYEDYAKKCNADLVVLDGYTQGWWGLEKFRVRPFVEAYERTCFLDSDIIIQKSAPNIFDLVPHNQIGMHDDWPLLISKSKNIGDFNFDKWRTYERNFLIKSQVLEEDFSYEQHHTLFNTGVVVCSKKHANIWTPMKKPFPRNHCDEQFWIEYLALKNNHEIYRLPLSMNIQHWMDCFDKMATLEMSHFLHLAIDITRHKKEDVLKEVYTKYAD